MANSHRRPTKDPPTTSAGGRPVVVLTRPFGLPPGSEAVFRLYVGRHRLKPAGIVAGTSR